MERAKSSERHCERPLARGNPYGGAERVALDGVVALLILAELAYKD